MKRCVYARHALVLAGVAWVGMAAANTALNPYSAIVERNSFGLKPPPNPADLVKPPPPVVADIKLQGITTILGRKQVFMKIKVPAKPGEAARDESFVFVEGQREGEVEVLEINPLEGTVKVNNAGKVLALNMTDHGDKPTPGAAPAGPAPALPGGLPAPPRPAFPGAAAAAPAAANPAGGGGTTVTTFGGGSGAATAGFGSTSTATPGGLQKSLPTRTLRSNPSGTTGNPQVGEFQNISPEAQAILIEAQRSQIAPGGYDPLPKTAITPRDRLYSQPTQP